MFRLRSAACTAIVATLVLVPAAGHAATDMPRPGDSCADPVIWRLSGQEHAQLREDLETAGSITHGHVKIVSSPLSGESDTSIRVVAARGWRVCNVHASGDRGRSWSLPGTVGSAKRRSYAERLLSTFRRPARPRNVVVRYARRTVSDGTTCADPLVAYDSGGDPGASISSGQVDDPSDGPAGRVRWVARWELDPGSELCYVKGLADYGRPFTLREQGDGSHTMATASDVGNHFSPQLYLLIAFRRG